MTAASSLRQFLPINILRASVSTSLASLAFVFFFSNVATCGETFACRAPAFVADLVVLKFTGGVSPAVPGLDAFLLAILMGSVFVRSLILLSLSCGFLECKSVNGELQPLRHKKCGVGDDGYRERKSGARRYLG